MLDGVGRFPIPKKEELLESRQSAEGRDGEKRGRETALLRLDECVRGGLEAVDTLGGAL